MWVASADAVCSAPLPLILMFISNVKSAIALLPHGLGRSGETRNFGGNSKEWEKVKPRSAYSPPAYGQHLSRMWGLPTRAAGGRCAQIAHSITRAHQLGQTRTHSPPHAGNRLLLPIQSAAGRERECQIQ